MTNKVTAADALEAMAATFRERNAVYGNNFERLGHAMHAMFPQGLTIDNPDDWTRLYFFFLQQVKLSRYATNFKRGGHKDSTHDTSVYAALLEAFDDNLRNNHQQVGARNSAKARNAPARAQANGGRRQR